MNINQLFWKTVTAAAMSFAFGTVAHAQATGNGGAWFASPGDLPAQSAKLTTLDALAITPDSNGDRLFSLDVVYGDDATSESGVGIEVHFDSTKIELVSTENVDASGGVNAGDNAASLTQTAYAAFTTANGRAPATLTTPDAAADSLIYPGWSSFTAAGFAPTATLEAPLRLLTLNLKFLSAAEGDSKIHIVQGGATVLASISGYPQETITITGPEVAQRANLTLAYGSDGAGA
ncbi:MAG: hypothetical protein MPJ22_10765, partial [Pirellulales bacterium]|nr:hypothetical protein [Pirellulales bacterium]